MAKELRVAAWEPKQEVFGKVFQDKRLEKGLRNNTRRL